MNVYKCQCDYPTGPGGYAPCVTRHPGSRKVIVWLRQGDVRFESVSIIDISRNDDWWYEIAGAYMVMEA